MIETIEIHIQDQPYSNPLTLLLGEDWYDALS